MNPTALKIGEVVQLNPDQVYNKAFAGCFMVVTEPKNWGAQGYIQGVGDTRDHGGGQYYYRAKWEEMESVGSAIWLISCEPE